jgi:hypothetical protein
MLPSQRITKEARFAALLDQCGLLQHHLVQLEKEDTNLISNEDALSPKTERHNLPEEETRKMLGIIDDSCKLMLEWCNEDGSSTTSTRRMSNVDSATASLVIALVFKILQVCDILLSGRGLRIRSMNDVLLQKRLDFNITQTRIITTNIERSTQGMTAILGELTARAVDVEKNFVRQRGR